MLQHSRCLKTKIYHTFHVNINDVENSTRDNTHMYQQYIHNILKRMRGYVMTIQTPHAMTHSYTHTQSISFIHTNTYTYTYTGMHISNQRVSPSKASKAANPTNDIAQRHPTHSRLHREENDLLSHA